jgi:ribosomal protein L24
MAHAMKVKKGDLVQVLSGKDRGKQGRVLEARPKEGRVLVENLNMIKRHTRPRPMSNPSRMADPDLECDGGLPGVQPPDTGRDDSARG